jgi:hypothetical protein
LAITNSAQFFKKHVVSGKTVFSRGYKYLAMTDSIQSLKKHAVFGKTVFSLGYNYLDNVGL